MANDIIELRSTGNDGADISINLINNGMKTELVGFGLNADLNFVEIDGDYSFCYSNNESASFIKIQNGQILKSKCLGKSTSRYRRLEKKCPLNGQLCPGS